MNDLSITDFRLSAFSFILTSMIQRAKRFVRKPTSINILVNTGGSVLTVFLSAMMHFFLFRIMTPADYGILTIWLSVIYVAANMLDFGTTATIYAYLPPLLEKKDDEFYSFLKTIFAYQLVLVLVMAMIFIFLFPVLDTYFLKTRVSSTVMWLSIAAIVGFILQNFIFNLLFGAKRFVTANLFNSAANLTKLIALIICLRLNIQKLEVILIILTVFGVFLFVIPVAITKRALIQRVLRAKLDKSQLKLKYTFAYLLSSQVYSLGQRIDLFMLSYFGLADGAGYYAAAQKIVLSIATAVVSITQVLSPMFTHANTQAKVRTLIKQSLTYLLIPTGLFLALLITPQFVFDIYLSKFASSAPVARALALPFVIFTLGNIAHLFMLYSAKKSHAILCANIVYFLVMAVGSYVGVGQWGAVALPYVVGASFTCAITILTIWSIKEYQRLPAK